MKRLFLGVFLGLVASPALAEVKTSSSNGFEIEHRVEVALSPTRLFGLIGDVRRWWSDSHTYSGKAANLSLALVPGGCWCETLPGGGGVEHMRVAYVEPGKRIVMTGSLGPLLSEATSGVMQIAIEPTATGSTLVMNYRAAGFFNGGAGKLAPLVDQVLSEQVKRIVAAGSGR